MVARRPGSSTTEGAKLPERRCLRTSGDAAQSQSSRANERSPGKRRLTELGLPLQAKRHEVSGSRLADAEMSVLDMKHWPSVVGDIVRKELFWRICAIKGKCNTQYSRPQTCAPAWEHASRHASIVLFELVS